jgi:hypothetical protein
MRVIWGLTGGYLNTGWLNLVYIQRLYKNGKPIPCLLEQRMGFIVKNELTAE